MCLEIWRRKETCHYVWWYDDTSGHKAKEKGCNLLREQDIFREHSPVVVGGEWWSQTGRRGIGSWAWLLRVWTSNLCWIWEYNGNHWMNVSYKSHLNSFMNKWEPAHIFLGSKPCYLHTYLAETLCDTLWMVL